MRIELSEGETLYTFQTKEENEAKLYMQARDTVAVIWELDQWLRGKIKHESRDDLEAVRDTLWELIRQYNVNINI